MDYKVAPLNLIDINFKWDKQLYNNNQLSYIDKKTFKTYPINDP